MKCLARWIAPLCALCGMIVSPVLLAQDQPKSQEATPPAKFLVVDGSDSEHWTASAFDEPCKGDSSKCFAFTTTDSTLLAGTVKVIGVAEKQMTFSFTPAAAGAGDPAIAYIGLPDQPKNRYLITSVGTTRRQVIAGAFCSSAGAGLCSCDGKISGYVFDQAYGVSYPVTVESVTPTRAMIDFSVPKDFTPRTVFLVRGKESGNFAFKPAPAMVKTQLVYQAYDLSTLCKSNETPNNCLGHTKASSPDQPGTTVDLLAMQDSLLFVSVAMDEGTPPNTLVAVDTTTGQGDAGQQKTVLLRRVTKESSEQALIDVDMTSMDQETVRRDFGKRIAEHYLAITLDVSNRTEKKLQFSKSDIWFDADYRAVGKGSRHLWNFVAPVADAATAGTLFTPNVYNPTFDPYDKKERDKCLKRGNFGPGGKPLADDRLCDQVFYRYGIEQTTRLTPVNYMTALAAFDFTTEKTDSILRFVELIGATLIPISGGSIVAQIHNTAFHDSISIFTGTVLPGYRALELDPAHINRLRSNLVSQTLQETIAIPPRGKVTTVVLLPRDGMLAIRGRDQSVVIDRLVDVHIDPDVVNGAKGAPVAADVVQVGYTMDQVREALGEPYKVTPDETSGQTVFNYKTGAYSDVTFNKDGKVIASTQYTLAQQLANQSTLPAATDFLRRNKLSWTRLSLLNGNSILVDIPTMDNATAPLFDSKDNLIGTYTLLYASILSAASNSPKISDFSGALSKMYLGSGEYPVQTGPGGKNGKLTFAMPDVVGGTIIASLDATGTLIQPKLEFTGSHPISFSTKTATDVAAPKVAGDAAAPDKKTADANAAPGNNGGAPRHNPVPTVKKP